MYVSWPWFTDSDMSLDRNLLEVNIINYMTEFFLETQFKTPRMNSLYLLIGLLFHT